MFAANTFICDSCFNLLMANELGKVGIANALQPEAPDITPVILGCFAKFVQHMHAASSQNCDIAIRFNDPNFLKDSHNYVMFSFCDLDF